MTQREIDLLDAITELRDDLNVICRCVAFGQPDTAFEIAHRLHDRAEEICAKFKQEQAA